MNQFGIHKTIRVLFLNALLLGLLAWSCTPSASLVHAAIATQSDNAAWKLLPLPAPIYACKSQPNTFFAVNIKGVWAKPIAITVTNLPRGSTFYTKGSPIPPGISNGNQNLAWVYIHVPRSTPKKTFTLQLVANNGLVTQKVPVYLHFRCPG